MGSRAGAWLRMAPSLTREGCEDMTGFPLLLLPLSFYLLPLSFLLLPLSFLPPGSGIFVTSQTAWASRNGTGYGVGWNLFPGMFGSSFTVLSFMPGRVFKASLVHFYPGPVYYGVSVPYCWDAGALGARFTPGWGFSVFFLGGGVSVPPAIDCHLDEKFGFAKSVLRMS